MDTPIFEWQGVAISSLSEKQLLNAIVENKKSRNYPDSATMILVGEFAERSLQADIELAAKQAEARERAIREILDKSGGDDDGGNE